MELYVHNLTADIYRVHIGTVQTMSTKSVLNWEKSLNLQKIISHNDTGNSIFRAKGKHFCRKRDNGTKLTTWKLKEIKQSSRESWEVPFPLWK